MQGPLTQPELQEQTLCLYGELVALAPDWAHRLVLGLGVGCSTSGLPAACSLAGAASLFLEGDFRQAKAALRDGGLDFLVSTVDEALRTLKNEVRKGRPLAVALVGDATAAEAELHDRGVLPDLLFGTDVAALRKEHRSGWAGIPELILQADDGTSGRDRLRGFLSDRGLVTHTWQVRGRPELRALDAKLLTMIPEDDSVRRRWLQGIARHQRSADESHRVAWLTPEETARVVAVLGAQAL